MTAITLPITPLPLRVTPRLIDFGIQHVPPLGGVEQRVGRIGSRFAVDIELPTMEGQHADRWLGALMKAYATGSTVIFNWPQVAARSSPGPILVNGASQAGTSLVCDAAAATIHAGQFFSVTVSSRNYLYMVTDEATPVSGAVTLSIAPMLRASPADDAVLNFSAPQIEGFLQGDVMSWTRERLRWDTLTFTVQEAQ